MSVSRFTSTRAYLPALLLVVAGTASAQYDSGTVLGVVKDTRGAIVPGSHVVLQDVNKGTTVERAANSDGEYEFSSVLPGNYIVMVTQPGFRTEVTAPFQVTVSARQRVDLSLEVGQVDQTVTVTDAAALLETDSSDRGEVVAAREIVNLPLNGRDPSDLTLLVPGARKSVLENESGTSREASYNINGFVHPGTTSSWTGWTTTTMASITRAFPTRPSRSRPTA